MLPWMGEARASATAEAVARTAVERRVETLKAELNESLAAVERAESAAHSDAVLRHANARQVGARASAVKTAARLETASSTACAVAQEAQLKSCAAEHHVALSCLGTALREAERRAGDGELCADTPEPPLSPVLATPPTPPMLPLPQGLARERDRDLVSELRSLAEEGGAVV